MKILQIFAIIIKDSKLLLREVGGLILLFILPAVFIIILSIALQGAFTSVQDTKYKLEILLINHDTGKTGEKLITELEASGKFKIITKIQKKKLTKEIALNEVNNGGHEIAIYIPKNTSAALNFRKQENIEIFIDPALGNEFTTFINSIVQNFIHKQTIEKILGREIKKEKDSKGLFVKQTYTSGSGEAIMPNSVQQNVPGWTIFALFWISQTIALNIINEKLSGAFKRIMVSPVSRTSYIIGKITPFFFINIIQASFLFAIGVYLLPYFGCPKLEIQNLTGLFIMTIGISFASICMGLLFSSVSNSLFSAATISVTFLVIMTIIGGIMIPKLIMPEFMQKLSLTVPQGWALDGYQNILVRGQEVEDILKHFFVLIAFGFAFFVSSLIFFRKEI